MLVLLIVPQIFLFFRKPKLLNSWPQACIRRAKIWRRKIKKNKQIGTLKILFLVQYYIFIYPG